MCNLASIALPRFVRETEPHGREGKKLVGSLDAANRSGKGNPTNSQPVCLPAAGHFSLQLVPVQRCGCIVPVWKHMSFSRISPAGTGTLTLTSWLR